MFVIVLHVVIIEKKTTTFHLMQTELGLKNLRPYEIPQILCVD